MAVDKNSNGWAEYSRLVLAELERHSQWLEALDLRFEERVKETTKEISELRVKAGLWGVLGGAIPLTIVIILELLRYFILQ